MAEGARGDAPQGRSRAPVSTRRAGAPAIEKGAAILSALASSNEPLTLSQLMRSTNLARSSVHDVCASLVSTGLAEKSGEGTYEIGLGLVELARKRLNSMEIVSTFQAVCRAASPSSETIVLSVLNGGDVIYVSFIPGNRPLAVRYQVGMRLPAAFTASGKAILSTQSDDEVRAVLGDGSVNPHGDGRWKSTDELLLDLRATRERGYSIDDEETAAGMTCVGAAIFAAGERTAAGAVAVSMVKSNREWLDPTIREYVCGIAAEISRRLGGQRALESPTSLLQRR